MWLLKDNVIVVCFFVVKFSLNVYVGSIFSKCNLLYVWEEICKFVYLVFI